MANTGKANRCFKPGAALTNPLFEPVMSSPADMKEISIGYLCYYKPQAGLTLLREQILGPERLTGIPYIY